MKITELYISQRKSERAVFRCTKSVCVCVFKEKTVIVGCDAVVCDCYKVLMVQSVEARRLQGATPNYANVDNFKQTKSLVKS